MRRTDIAGDDGQWSGLALEVRSPRRPGLCLFTAERRLLLVQESRPVLLAVVDEDNYGVEFWRTDAYRSLVPPLRADTARALGGQLDRWAHRFAQQLLDAPDGPLHEGRWLLTRESLLLRWNHLRAPEAEYWNGMLVEGHPDGYIDWFVHSGSWEILPLRPMPAADDGRVKAYRKQARDGTLPPVLLWWVSGLDCHLILDGHARLAAAIAESTTPPLLEVQRAAPSDEVAAETEQAVHHYEAELTRFAELRTLHGTAVPDGAAIAGPSLAHRLQALHTAQRPTWAWPLPGGAVEWKRVARDVTAGRKWDAS
ncbi:hypothetical protein LXH13_01020 [Streptomyces spinosirectus]|jgi:hypothetical protein|uniref:hypothetical protein n=1 Tax=Streptomyces TaxID=1883 RepID=UPI000D364206|nr:MULTISPECIES: hypothetical protein [Streptomyces]MBY8339612.1 hypothetical protein [Streptomyces plumbidurans]UIR15688.1 hypothetical protein LXH13_01020 [Streptomyces spinosirectus]